MCSIIILLENNVRNGDKNRNITFINLKQGRAFVLSLFLQVSICQAQFRTSNSISHGFYFPNRGKHLLLIVLFSLPQHLIATPSTFHLITVSLESNKLPQHILIFIGVQSNLSPLYPYPSNSLLFSFDTSSYIFHLL